MGKVVGVGKLSEFMTELCRRPFTSRWGLEIVVLWVGEGGREGREGGREGGRRGREGGEGGGGGESEMIFVEGLTIHINPIISQFSGSRVASS